MSLFRIWNFIRSLFRSQNPRITELPSAPNTTLKFVNNVELASPVFWALAKGLYVGRPQSLPNKTAEQLLAMGTVGLYEEVTE